MSVLTTPAGTAVAFDVVDMTGLASRYARVLVSRRLVRAFAAATLIGVFMLLTLAVTVLPIRAPTMPTGDRMFLRSALVTLFTLVAGLSGLVLSCCTSGRCLPSPEDRGA